MMSPQLHGRTEFGSRVSAAVAVDVATLLRRNGCNARAIFNQAGVDIAATRDPYTMIEFDAYAELLRLSAHYTKCANLGLELGLNQDPTKWGALGYLILNSPTIFEAFSNFAAYFKIGQTNTYLKCRKRNGAIGIEYSLLEKEIAHREYDAEFAIAYFKNIMDRIADYPVKPLEVNFEHKPLFDISVYRRCLGVEPRFQQPLNVITYPQSLADRPIRTADQRLLRIIKHHLAELLEGIQESPDLIDLVKHQITNSLAHDQCDLTTIANKIGLQPRTLQRRLAEKNARFGSLLEEVRQRQAGNLLSSSNMEIKEISHRLGYSEVGTFQKAFKKWTGTTPGDYRHNCNGSLQP